METLKNKKIKNIIDTYKEDYKINVTEPSMPPLEKYNECLKEIWETKWLTNNGKFHLELEKRLEEYLEVKHLNAFTNGTISLMVALQALRINSGEVITTPFTFAATPHVLYWNKVKPVFCDINRKDYCIDTDRIEELITPDTKAIMPVHVYGNPCEVEKIKKIAERHGLHVIYDAAHAFGVKINGVSILEYGDVSSLSFHATKLFSTIEGGALVSNSEVMKKRITYLKNFGIANEDTVIGPGINGKMNEFQAAFGLLQLETVEEEINKRKKITETYRNELKNTDGIICLEEKENVKHNYSYFPVLVDKEFSVTRDELNEILRKCNIVPRKYFYPLCSEYPCYRNYSSSSRDKLTNAVEISEKVLCLPIYGDLKEKDVKRVCNIIRSIK